MGMLLLCIIIPLFNVIYFSNWPLIGTLLSVFVITVAIIYYYWMLWIVCLLAMTAFLVLLKHRHMVWSTQLLLIVSNGLSALLLILCIVIALWIVRFDQLFVSLFMSDYW